MISWKNEVSKSKEKGKQLSWWFVSMKKICRVHGEKTTFIKERRD